jgi:hypothetical protein
MDQQPRPNILHVFLFMLLLIFGILIFATIVLPKNIESVSVITNNADPHLNTMGYAPHMVMIEIFPEQEGLTVIATPDKVDLPEYARQYIGIVDNQTLPTMIGITDNKSRVVFPMIGSVKYTVNIPERNKSVMIFPTDTLYKWYTERWNND